MFNIIVITAENIINCEAEIINTLFHSGLSRLHLRKPKATYSQMEEIINCIDKRYYDRIVVHDHHELAVKYNLGGIHILIAFISDSGSESVAKTAAGYDGQGRV